ncbi:MFS transporter [Streptomyces sp. BE303]|uniref:MFS transporter n=1 Tax=Streptomyces sp. BE303 TaxID=3002528 RepID=UPI002E79539D|nr:MFS transporter [Streptomyces sp. BE303]MED7955144.1 MFS transporter [Streptomyces sp. BE303]
MSDVSLTRAAVAEPRGGRAGVVPVLALGTFAVGTDAFVVAGFLPELAADLGVSTSAAGQAVTVFAAAYALLSPVLATLTARVPRRTLLVTALAGLGAANLASALAPTFAALLATRVAAAGAAAAFTPNAGAVAASLARPERRARALAVVVGGLTAATALGVPLGGLAGQWTGWRWALAAVAGLALAAAGAVALLLPALPGGPAVALRERLAVLRRPAVRAILPLTALGMAAAYTVYAYSVPALAAVGLTARDAAWALGLYGVGAVLGNLGAGLATDRLGGVGVLTAGYLVMAVALGGLGLLAASGTRAPVLVGLLALAWGSSSWCQTPPQQHRLIAAAPQEAPLVVALNSSAIYAGIGAGTLSGGLTVHSGAAALYATATGLALLALLYLLLTAATLPRADRHG